MPPAAEPPRTAILVILFLGLMMAALDIAIIGPALPALQTVFHINERSSAWIYTSYILCSLISTPLMAKLSDMHGRRRVYLSNILMFAAGSLVVAVAPSFPVILAGRALQGLGAGGIFPVAIAVVGDMFPVEKRGMALGVLQAVFGIAMIMGPIVGGILLMFSWRYLFLINLPVAALIIAAGMRILPAHRTAQADGFDWTGSLLLAASLTLLSYGINRIDTTRLVDSLLSWQVAPLILLAAATFTVFLRVERRVRHPVIDLALFCSPHVLLGSTESFLMGLCISTFAFMPVMAVVMLGLAQSQASFILIPLVIAMSVMSVVAGKLLEVVSAKSEMIVGAVLLAGGVIMLGSFAYSAATFMLAGVLIGSGMAVMPIRFVMLAAVPSAQRTATQGLLSMNMSIGQMIGGVLLGAMIASGGSSADAYRFAYTAVGLASVSMVVIAFRFKGGKTHDVDVLYCKSGDSNR